MFIHIKSYRKTSLPGIVYDVFESIYHMGLLMVNLKKLLHGEVVISPDPKIISSIIKQGEYLDEELLSKTKNKFYTPDEFNNALKNLNMASQFFSMQLNILSFLSPP